MPANTTPIFILSGNMVPTSTNRLVAANTASDGSGTLYTLTTGTTNGTRVDAVRFRNSQATAAASSAMVHRVFLTDASGTNPTLVGEVATATATRSVSAIGATSIITFDQPLILKSGQLLRVCQSVYAGAQDQFDAIAYASDY
jgi:hypothetical protein